MSNTKQDFVKSVINFPKKLLSFVQIYPENKNKMSNICFFVMLASVFILEIAQIVYITGPIDLTELASACTTVSTNFQAIFKLFTLLLFRDRLCNMLQICRNDFWSIQAAEPHLQDSLRWMARLVTINMASILFTGLAFGAVFLTAPIFDEKEYQLPVAATYPFNWKWFPAYQILYCWQVATNLIFIVLPICGHDFLFIGLMFNCIAQFRLLKYAFLSLGDENTYQLICKLKNIEVLTNKDLLNEQLMKISIQHHISVLKFCDDIESVFSTTVFVQYLASVSAICVSSFLISLIENSSIPHLACFFAGHVFQLFMYCAAGNELLFASNEIAGAAFQSRWYAVDNKKLQRNLILIAQRSQKETRITALGFVDLSYESFVQVLKLSFSFNALLNSINEK